MATVAECKVLIIGAGISGLASAAYLHKGGIHDVIVLEARDRIGGRISTVAFDGVTIEEGATWVHGLQGNPIRKIIEAENIEVTEWNYLEKRKACDWMTDVGTLPNDDVIMLNDACQDHLAFMKELNLYEGDTLDSERLASYPRDLASILDGVWREFITKESETKRRYLLECLKRTFLPWDCSDTGVCSLSQCPTRLFDEYIVFNGSDVIVEGGYDQILKCFLRSIPASSLRLNCDVIGINWANQSASGKVEVSYNVDGNNHVFEADHVIVTVPLGCLKRNHVTLFTPGLPDEKVRAIEKIGFGKLAKIALIYNEPFWNPKKETIELLWQPKKMTSHWSDDLVEFIVRRSENIFWLETWIPGEKAIQVEESSSDDIARVVTDVFKHVTGNPKIPLPRSVNVSKFTTNNYTLGSYSYISHLSTGRDFEVLAEPLDGVGESSKLKLLFAGEATSRHRFGTVDGALLSGKREANRLLEHYGRASIISNL